MRTISAVVGCLVLLLVSAWLIVVQPGGSGVLASLRLADGSEYMVTQRCNWQAALDRKRGTFAIGNGRPGRELAAPQSYQEPQFPFPQ
jgi:hypothetical protein